MPNYQNGKIYIIRSAVSEDVYVGSTCEPTLARRLAKHRGTYKCWKNGTYHFVTSFAIFEQGDYYIELIENFPCANKDELTKREGWFIRNTEHTVNSRIAGRTNTEYYQDKKIAICAYQKTRYENNKDLINAKQKIYQQKNKDKIRAYKGIYYQENKATLRAKKKIYQQKNKDKIRAHASAKITCVCGLIGRRSHIARHKRTQQHQTFIEKYDILDSFEV